MNYCRPKNMLYLLCIMIIFVRSFNPSLYLYTIYVVTRCRVGAFHVRVLGSDRSWALLPR